jgi:asparagine synthase (glutamine-hydrolysing)
VCGIAGFVGPDTRRLSAEILPRMQDVILFRGRDEQGSWSDGESVALAQARLAIIDLAHGQQPMQTADGRLTLVFAGEIYNFVELRRGFEAEGATFRTRSDTEVVLEGYRLRGPDLVRELNGMFAIAVWDAERRELFLARDRVGEKPLYWTVGDGTFAFSSSLDAFANLPGWHGEISRGNTLLYGILGAFPGDRTVYTNANALPPASYLLARPDGAPPRPIRYWWPTFGDKSRLELHELERQYEELLVDATRIRLRSDVPTALSFSGGIDSGSIAWACARKLETPIRCFTIDHDTAEEPSSETHVARLAASSLGLPWEHIQFDPYDDVLSNLADAYAYYDEPCSQLPLVYAHRLYERIRPHATVVLSGNGGDELFTGYVGDEAIRRRDLVALAAHPLRPLLRRIQRLPGLLRLTPPEGLERWLVSEARDRSHDPEVLATVASAAATLADDARAAAIDSWLDLHMLSSTCWTNRDGNIRLGDISGLAAQVEVRSPFFDHRLIEFAAILPHRYKVSRLWSPRGNKFLPQRVYARDLPEEVTSAPKRGMAANIRWDRSIALERSFETAFRAAYDDLERAGLDERGASRRSWESYRAAVRRGADGSPFTGAMMTGFMLGVWLRRARRVLPAAA